MLIETLSANLTRALKVNHGDLPFETLVPLSAMPIRTVASIEDGDGIISAGTGGEYSANRLFLLPISDGAPGSAFSMRLYGFRTVSVPDSGSGYAVWISYLICELACITCALSGPGPLPFQFLDTEFLCDTISLTQGSLGKDGVINSTGPGTNLAAYALVDIVGSKEVYFDFQRTDPVNMNCFWARA